VSKLADWLDIRPQETRRVIQATLGAFLIMAFLVLGRALRESLYLTTFAVETLPYITAAVALSTLPAVALFTRRLSHSSPQRVLAAVTLMVVAGQLVDRLAGIALVDRPAHRAVAAVPSQPVAVAPVADGPFEP
jgi:hypothetical protein